MPISPPITLLQGPPFWELGAHGFQKFCSDIFGKEKDITLCQEYGVNGDTQDGIDLIAQIQSGTEQETAQCKAQQEVSQKNIRDACDEFLKHVIRWKNDEVRRFVLIYACDVRSRKIQDENRAQQKRFNKEGIRFELWGNETLKAKARLYREIVACHCGGWTENICGPITVTPATVSSSTSLGIIALTGHLGDITTELADQKRREIDHLTHCAHEHKYGEVLVGLRAMKAAKSWSGLPPALRSRILRFESSAILNDGGNVDEAASLVADARLIDPAGDYQVIDAYIAYRRGRRSDAMQLLAPPNSINALNLRLGLLFERMDPDAVIREAHSSASRWSPDVHTHRWIGLAHLVRCEMILANEAVEKAMVGGSTFPPIREASALIDYFSAVSPACDDVFTHLSWPLPLPFIYIKRDPVSLQRLRRAADIFASLEKSASETDEKRRLARWRLGCLGSDLERQTEAQHLGQELLRADATDPGVIAWMIERGYSHDPIIVCAALQSELQKDSATPDQVLALSAELQAQGDKIGAANVLESHRDLFTKVGRSDLCDTHIASLRGEVITLKSGALSESGQSIDLLLMQLGRRPINQLGPEWISELTRFAEAPGGGQALFMLCEIWSKRGQWSEVADRAELLINKVGTEPALRMALFGLVNSKRYQSCLDLLAQNTHMLRGGKPQGDLLVLRSECRKRLGQVSEAVQDARQAFDAGQSFPQMLNLFRAHLTAGDATSVLLTARDSLRSEDVPAEFHVEAASLIAPFDRELARKLWLKANEKGLTSPSHLLSAQIIATKLGLMEEASVIRNKLIEASKNDGSGVQMLSLEDVIRNATAARHTQQENVKAYEQGRLATHFLEDTTGDSLSDIYLRLFDRNLKEERVEHRRPIYVVPAAKDFVEQATEIKPTVGSVHADITALLLGSQLDVLDQIEATWGPIKISTHITTCLFQELEKLPPASSADEETEVVRTKLQRLLERIRAGIESGTYVCLPEASLKAHRKNPAVTTATSRSLIDLMGSEEPNGEFAWVDDRMLGGYSTFGSRRVVSSFELLHALQSSSVLSQEELYGRIDLLRRGCVRYVPVTSDEILFLIAQAPIEANTLKPIPALELMRRYLAACLVDADRLRPPHQQSKQNLENYDYAFVFGASREVRRAVMKVWEQDDSTPDIQEARANWIWGNLCYDWSAVFNVLLDAPKATGASDTALNFIVESIAVYFIEALGLTSNSAEDDSSPRIRYFSWLMGQVIEPLVRSNPGIEKSIGRAIGRCVSLALKAGHKNTRKYGNKGLVRFIIRNLVSDLPDLIVHELGLSDREWRDVGIVVHGPSVSVDGMDFLAQPYWDAAASAINGGTGRVTIRGDKTEVRLTRIPDPDPASEKIRLLLNVDGKEKPHTVYESLHHLLLEDVPERKSFLLSKRLLIDGSQKWREDEAARIANIKSNYGRMDAAMTRRDESIEYFYTQLASRLKRHESFAPANLFPSEIAGLRRHLHLLDSESAVQWSIEKLATDLLAEHGIKGTLRRLIHLPVPLPDAVLKAVQATAPEEIIPLLASMEKHAGSPVACVHFVHLYGVLSEKNEATADRAKKILLRLFSDPAAAHRLSCFSSILKLSWRQLRGFDASETPESHLAVIWYHTSRIISLLESINYDPEKLRPILANCAAVSWLDVFEQTFKCLDDVAHPNHFCSALLLHSIDHFLPDFPEKTIQALGVGEIIKTCVTRDDELSGNMRAGMLTDWTLYRNSLGSFLNCGAPSVAPWQDDLPQAGSAKTCELARNAIHAIKAGDYSRQAWVRLYALLRETPCPAEINADLDELLSIVDFQRLNTSGVGVVVLIVPFIARRIKISGTPSLLSYMNKGLETLVEMFAREPDGAPAEWLQKVSAIMEAHLVMSMSSWPNGTIDLKEFCERNVLVAQTWPSSAKLIRDVSSDWRFMVKMADQPTVWSAFLRMRTLL